MNSFDASAAYSQSYLPTLLRQWACNKGRAKMCTTWWPTNALGVLCQGGQRIECKCSRSLAYGTDTVSMFITWFSFVEMANLLKDRGARRRWNSVSHKTAVNDFLAPLSSATGQHVTATGSACQSLIWLTIGGWTGVGFRFASSQLSALENRVRPDSI